MNAGYNVFVAVAALWFLVVAPYPAKSCPVDFSVLNNYSSSLKAACNEGNLTSCCEAVGAGVEICLAKYLQDTQLFLLQNATQARLCMRRLRAQLQVIGLDVDLVRKLNCSVEERDASPASGGRVSAFYWQPELCQGIESEQDFQRVAAPLGPMEQSCRAYLADVKQCQECSNNVRAVQNRLSIGPMSVNCFNFVRMYVVQDRTSHPAAAIFCVYALAVNPSPSQSHGVPQRQRNVGIAVVVAIGASSIIIGVALWARWRRYGSAVHREFLLRNNRMLAYHSTLEWYDWAVLKAASDGFSPATLLGEGGYGWVHKGTLRDGRVVALKKFKNCTPEGDHNFLNEVEALSKFRHKNLVNLQGCCIASRKRSGHQRILVYDYMHNRSLADYKSVLTWEQRRHIALGIAQGLAYLHTDAQPQIIHRDIKASNILLDAKLNAHIADFGLAKSQIPAADDSSPRNSHIKGTPGYVAPEYALYGQLSEKSDVYSFGVCLLELLSARPALAHSQKLGQASTDSRDSQPGASYFITDWAWSLIVNKRPLEIVDARIQADSKQIQAVMTRFVMVGMLCAHMMVAKRPTMAEALRMLEGHSDVPVDRLFEMPALPLSHREGDYVASLAGRYKAKEVDLTAK